MSGKSKKHKKEKPTVHVITKLPPHVVAVVAKTPLFEVAPEPHVVVAIPKSTWQKVKDWMKGRS